MTEGRAMHCSSCGDPIPSGQHICGTCGSPASAGAGPAADHDREDAPPATVPAVSVGVCPRCDYQGPGIPYFNRGPHMAALLGATFLTLPFALGAGGFLYYGVRRDHRICPRCGHGWGRMGERAVGRRVGEGLAAERRLAGAPPGGGIERSWSVMLFVLGAILLGVGALQIDVILLTLGVLSTAGAVFLQRQANRAREMRRAALIASLQAPVLKLAAERSGRLTVTDVAASLGWSLRRAEKVLHSLDDGWRVSSDVTDEGVIVYEFREILLGPGTSG